MYTHEIFVLRILIVRKFGYRFRLYVYQYITADIVYFKYVQEYTTNVLMPKDSLVDKLLHNTKEYTNLI